MPTTLPPRRANAEDIKTRTHFTHRIDMLDAAGEIQEHLAGVEDYILAEAVWREAIARWPSSAKGRGSFMTAAHPVGLN